MFGYLTMHNRFQTFKMHRCYANYYCGTCFGLEHNFGQISRFLLSNDVALLGILMKCHEEPLRPRYLCYGKCKEKHCIFHGGMWSQMAAMNILLVNEKIKDDRNDEHSWKAFFARILLSGQIRRAQKRYPEMAKEIAQGYVQMYRLECEGSGVRPIEECFADMMVNTLSTCRKLQDWEVDYIRHISKWIYYIDALDDYEEDCQAGRFNSLKKEDAKTMDAYTRKYMHVIIDDIKYIYQDMDKLLEAMPQEKTEDFLLRTLICNDIPLRTAKVLSKRKMDKVKIGSIWEGSDRSA